MTPESTRAATRWSTRIIPLVLAGCVGFATYVVVKRVCLDWFRGVRHRDGVADTFIALYLFFFVLMLVAYVRLFALVQWNPDVLPLGPRAIEGTSRDPEKPRTPRRRRSEARAARDLEAQRYSSGPDADPDSPGLETFYSKDAFVCEMDGRPRWCSSCCHWKPDRAYHSSEIDRCVKKLDHFCPWVGGIVSQSSYKIFLQLMFYTTLYCVVVLAATVISLREKLREGQAADGQIVAIIGIGAFFGLFTFMMTMTSVRFVLKNVTNVEEVKQKGVAQQLAIRVPRSTPPNLTYGLITYPLPRPDGTPGSHLSWQTVVGDGSPSSSDLTPTRTFAIVRTEVGENPWDLGPYRNWKSVMGENVLDWLLPIKPSPCVDSETHHSFYEMDVLCQRLRSRYQLPEVSEDSDVRDGTELRRLERHT